MDNPFNHKLFQRFSKEGNLLLIDNNPGQEQSLRYFVAEVWPGWKVQCVDSADGALVTLHEMANTTGLPDVISVDLALDESMDPMVGLEVLRQVNDKYRGSVRLVVHSSLGLKQLEAEYLHKIMAVPASYVTLQNPDAGVAFAMTLPLIAAGYLVYSQYPASLFPTAIAIVSDPLRNDDDWRLLKILHDHQDKRIEDIGRLDGVNLVKSSVEARMRSIAEKLYEARFIDVKPGGASVPDKFRKPLVQFWVDHHVRFGR
jgi:CheY-like chemotaxis protein